MVAFAGWEMPLHYGSQLQEHHAVREQVGLFDVSHMGQLLVHGAEADAVLEVGRLLGQIVRASRVLETEQRLVQELRELARTGLLWALPLALAPPMFSKDVYSYLAQSAITAMAVR